MSDLQYTSLCSVIKFHEPFKFVALDTLIGCLEHPGKISAIIDNYANITQTSGKEKIYIGV